MGKKGLIFYITLFLLILAFSTAATHFDYDLWARLIAGMGVIDGGHVLKQDFLSYTPVHTWWDHEWGSGVIFYFFLKFFGPYSLIILQALLTFGILFTASRVIKLKTEKCPYNILFYFFTLMAVMENLNNPVRCHMFSFLLFTVFIYILEKVRRGSNKLLFIIPFLIIFWNNVHGGVVSGLGLIAMYALGEFLNKKPYLKYIITLAASALVLLINPWGYQYIKFLLMANSMQRPYIVEWWGLFSKFYMFKQIKFKLFMLAIILIEAISIYKNIRLPKRATSGSAGHDISIPFEITVSSGCTLKIPTGIRCKIDEGYVMFIFPRSSLGIKKGLKILNTIPVIDSDYYEADNEGHIFICIKNDSNTVMKLKSGDNVVQAVFVPYGIADEEEINAIRTGGIGSTD